MRPRTPGVPDEPRLHRPRHPATPRLPGVLLASSSSASRGTTSSSWARSAPRSSPTPAGRSPRRRLGCWAA
ncbi:hypothetical protein ACFQVA_15480 [Actinomadura keratinilytica]